MGQQQDFARTALPHLDAAFDLAFWLMRDRGLAEEVVQDAFERALRYFASYRGDGARAWLLRIVRTTAYDTLSRRRGVAEVQLPEAPGLELVDAAADPEAALADKQAILRLDDALLALPDEWRECLVLRELEGLSYAEIAAVTGVPLGTVMSRLWRARQALLRRRERDER